MLSNINSVLMVWFGHLKMIEKNDVRNNYILPDTAFDIVDRFPERRH